MGSAKNEIELNEGRAARHFFNRDKMVPLIIFIALVVLIGSANQAFFEYQTWQNLMMQVSNVGIIALGAMFVVCSGGLDFTAGEGVSLAGIFAATAFVASGMNNAVTIIAGLAMGAAMGAANGLLIVKLKIQPFITTLSMKS